MRTPVHFAFAAACAALMQSACAVSSPPNSCTISGEKHLPAGVEARDLCAAFSARLDRALAERGGKSASDRMILALALNGRGSIEVQAIPKGAGQGEQPLEAAVDVMDRDINATDFDQLADVLAEIMTE